MTETDSSNWLTTLLIGAVGQTEVMRTRARIVFHDNVEVCRIDVAPATRPVWARTSVRDRVFFVRANNSTREMPDAEVEDYILDRWHAGAPVDDPKDS